MLTFTEEDRPFLSLSDTPVVDSNVLRKVASLTLERHAEPKVTRPKFVPEKLNFQLYEKFEGMFSSRSIIIIDLYYKLATVN